MKVELNAANYERACEALGIRPLRVTFWPGTKPGSADTRGTWSPAGVIDVYLGAFTESKSNITHLTKAITRTILHELRHEFQHTHWSRGDLNDKPGAYWTTKIEEDAREW